MEKSPPVARSLNGRAITTLSGIKIDPGKPQKNGFIESFNGSLRDELLKGEIFDTLDDASRKLTLWRYDYNNVRPNSPLGNKTTAEACRPLDQTDDQNYDAQSCKLSL